jgi:hypothetical protein
VKGTIKNSIQKLIKNRSFSLVIKILKLLPSENPEAILNRIAIHTQTPAQNYREFKLKKLIFKASNKLKSTL